MHETHHLDISRSILVDPRHDIRRLLYTRERIAEAKALEQHRLDHLQNPAAAGLKTGSTLLNVAGLIPLGGFLFHLAGAGLGKAAEPFARTSASAVLVKDGRLPTLYLRSFRDDKKKIGGTRLEVIVQGVASKLGPLVAIGEPGEILPLAGAARDYVSHDTWQEYASAWTQQACWIAIVVGETPGIAWEALHVAQKGVLAKVSLVLPPPTAPEAADRRWKAFLENLRHRRRQTAGRPVRSGRQRHRAGG